MFFCFFRIILGLCFCTRESTQLFLERPVLFGPSEILAKKVADFQCEISNPWNQSILLQLFKEGKHDDVLGEYTLLKGEELAVIPKVIRTIHEGYLECVARVQNNSEILPTVSDAYFMKVVEPVKGAAIVYSGETELYEGHELELQCTTQAGNHLTYQWWLNDQLIAPSPFHMLADNRLVVSRVASMDSGSYVCEASNIFNNTEKFTNKSSEVVIKVKDLVSTPDISFTVTKDNNQAIFAIVTCQSARGALPISFSLYNNTELLTNVTTEEKQASFKLPVVFNQPLVHLQCRANNGDESAYSQWLPLEVVPVAAPVMFTYKYDMAENYAVIGLRLYCKAAKGSHPQFQWYHNNIRLDDRGSFYYVYNQLPKESILLLSVGRSSAGRYHCEVSDRFDNTTSIISSRRYFDKEVLNCLPNLVVAVVFGCFTVMILLVSFCCLMGVMFRSRQNKEKSLLDLEMEMAAPTNELDLSDYEDLDVADTAKEDEFDQGSEVSVDEWPQIEQEKKTREDKQVSETF